MCHLLLLVGLVLLYILMYLAQNSSFVNDAFKNVFRILWPGYLTNPNDHYGFL
jgi:hypothetical protein